MARIAGIDLPRNKRIEIALTYIFGIGRNTATRVLQEAKVEPSTKTSDLTDAEITGIRQVIDHTCKVEGDLRREVSMNIKRIVDIGTYRGSRHRKNLPVRGQRTRTNSRTRKGPKKTVGSGRKKEDKK